MISHNLSRRHARGNGAADVYSSLMFTLQSFD